MVESILPNSSLQCEHFFLPLTLKSRSLEPLEDFPSADGGLRGGTCGPGSPLIFDVGGPGGISLKKKKKKRKFTISDLLPNFD